MGKLERQRREGFLDGSINGIARASYDASEFVQALRLSGQRT
jgi:hypothetical protein